MSDDAPYEAPYGTPTDNVLGATWLSADVLVVALSLPDGPVGGSALRAETDDGVALDVRRLPVDEQRMLLVFGGEHAARAADAHGLVLTHGTGELVLTPTPLSELVREPGTWATQCFEDLEAETRLTVLRFLADETDVTPTIAALRDALRDRLPMSKVAPERISGVRLDSILRIDESTFWVTGWVRDPAFAEVELSVLSPEGIEAPLHVIGWQPRADVAKAYGDADDEASRNRGFYGYVDLGRPSAHLSDWVIQKRGGAGHPLEGEYKKLITDDLAKVRRALSGPLGGRLDDEQTAALAPLVERMQRRLMSQVFVEQVEDHGTIPEQPTVSLIIAIERRIDLVEHQFAQFVHEAGLHDAEIIYVAPPAVRNDLARILHQMHELYGVPTRQATLSRDGRWPGAINSGASIARGRLLLLFDANVFPDTPGWLGQLVQQYDETPGLGALGPKLVHEDGSIEHAGIEFAPAEDGTTWEPVYPYKGLHRSVRAANAGGPVPAVSTSCMLVAAEHFRRVGGVSHEYIDGERSQFDLCLRLAAAGLLNVYAPDVSLYRLERLANWAAPPGPARRYNAWLFGHRWGAVLGADAGANGNGATAFSAVGVPRALELPPPPTTTAGGPPPVEIVGVAPAAASFEVVARSQLERPQPGGEVKPYTGTYAIPIEGWAVGTNGEPLTVDVLERGRSLRTLQAAIERELPGDNGDGPVNEEAGFRTAIGALQLPTTFEVDLEAVAPDGRREALGTISGRRRPIASGYRTRLEPLLITTLGRTGSSWVALLLSAHPEIFAYRPFQYEVRMMGYWLGVLQTLAEPASYIQSIRPEMYEGHWWTGTERPSPLPLQLPEPRMAQWLGREGVESLAAYCQSRVEQFYLEAARVDNKPRARFFAEKGWPEYSVPRLVNELYPSGREVLLVRDFRDMVCSIFGYNAKRGFASFGRESAETDDQFILNLRDHATRMLESWHERKDSAFLLRYEDLILDPEPTLARLFEYVGVDADADTVSEVLADARSTRAPTQVAHQTSNSVEASVGRWREELPEHLQSVCEEAFGDILSEFGYGAAPDAAEAAIGQTAE